MKNKISNFLKTPVFSITLTFINDYVFNVDDIKGNTYWTRQCPNIYSTRQYLISTQLDKTQISTQLDKTQISTQLDKTRYLLN